MNVGIAIVAVFAVGATGVAAGYWLAGITRRSVPERSGMTRRVLFPFTTTLDGDDGFASAIRLAKAERATIVPTFLERVPRDRPLDGSAGVQESRLMPAMARIEVRAASWGVPVDWRTAQGRTYRDALRRLLERQVVILPSARTENGASRLAAPSGLRNRAEWRSVQ